MGLEEAAAISAAQPRCRSAVGSKDVALVFQGEYREPASSGSHIYLL